MAKVLFTPWKDQSQLLAVRNQFYPPPSYDGPDLRSKACAIVSSWKLRGNLPHPVEATALLTDAILHDDALKNSIFSIRATYAAAFCRFVTGLVDSKIHGQRKTMFQRAVDLGLPASFVELRHEATHRELPSLIVLRNATQRSLEWLWDYYWVKTDFNAALAPAMLANALVDEMNEGEDEVQTARAAARAGLEQFARDAENVEPPRKKRRMQQVSTLAAQLASLCMGSCGRSGVCGALLEEAVLVPGERKTGSSMNDAFTQWDPLLQSVTDEQNGFLTALVDEMASVLAFTDSSSTREDPFREGIYMWLDHILQSPAWESRRRLLSLAYLLSACNESQNHWTKLLRKGVRLEDAGISRYAVSNGQSHKSPKTETEMGDLGELDKYGWTTGNTWDSRPLGTV